MTEDQVKIRSFVFRLAAALAFLVLAAQLWRLQVLEGERFRELADANRFRIDQVDASRGVIYDRNDELLVRNRPVYNVVIIPAYLPEEATAEAQVFSRLSELLSLPITTRVDPINGQRNGYFQAINHHQFTRQPKRQIINPRSRQYINQPQGIRDAANANRFFAPFTPVTIAEDVDPVIVAKIEEERLTLRGVQIEISPSREYIHANLISHLLGYIGPIPSELFDQYETDGYELTDIVGLAGLEIGYEEWLRGIKGLETVEVDVTGRRVRSLNQLVETRPGYNLRLSLDLELQQAAAIALQEAMDKVDSKQGVVVALNPQNGEVLAMVSLPSFDNNLFSRGIPRRELTLLSEDPQKPLINHAIAGLYPPGSIFKVIPASGGLQEGTLTEQTTFVDQGVLYLPNMFQPDNRNLAQPFFCWRRGGHGPVNVVSALAWSCNVFFYQTGGGYPPAEYEGLGLSRLGRYAQMYGLGAQTRVDLPGEAAGLVPNEKWKRVNYAESWLTGDTYNMSIGQGFVLVTPLQMVNVYAAIANGGTLYRPHLVKEILDADGNLVETIEPEVLGRIELSRENMNLVRTGLWGAINWQNGTAANFFDVPGIDASGKTGTAEFCDNYPSCLDRDGRVKTSHAWFVSYAPTNNPEIVVIVFVYGGKQGTGVALQGSEVAVPVASKILRHYFNIPDEVEEEEAETETEEEGEEVVEEAVTEPDLGTGFDSRLLGTDFWLQAGANVSGFVFDTKGQGVENVRVEILVGDQPLTVVSSGETGQFDYTKPDTVEPEVWQLRLADFPEAPVITLDVIKGQRYLVEFEAQPPKETASVN
ncbi:MAG TPA: penicillin-binding protein 2 [Anaerolineae bacterium]|nr:penicillin-binding protein 2 [Anaerolineae bacterium]